MSCSYDADRDKFLGVEDLKKLMKKIKSSPLDPSGIEEMIREVDEDRDCKLCLREVTIKLASHSGDNRNLFWGRVMEGEGRRPRARRRGAKRCSAERRV